MAGVGKSSLTLQFMYDEFSEDYEPTKSASYCKKVSLDRPETNGIAMNLTIMDFAGINDISDGSNLDTICVNAEGIVLVFSINDAASLEQVKNIRESILVNQSLQKDVVFLLVGNKADLEEHRQVTHADAQALATQWGVPYLEVSAKISAQVDTIFSHIGYEVYQRKYRNAGINNFQEKRHRKFALPLCGDWCPPGICSIS